MGALSYLDLRPKNGRNQGHRTSAKKNCPPPTLSFPPVTKKNVKVGQHANFWVPLYTGSPQSLNRLSALADLAKASGADASTSGDDPLPLLPSSKAKS
jgi:hypothetical protein